MLYTDRDYLGHRSFSVEFKKGTVGFPAWPVKHLLWLLKYRS